VKRRTVELPVYRFGKRGVLSPGSRFRASLGPYYESADGSKVALNEHGPFTFIAFQDGSQLQQRILAFNADGAYCTLFVGRRHRHPDLPGVVNRPYRISGCSAGKRVRKVSKSKGAKQ
jgi:hypothetical protein